MQTRRAWWLALVLGSFACGGAVGDECSSADDCDEGLCVAGIDQARSCTKSCTQDAECPEHWSCTGVTEIEQRRERICVPAVIRR